MAIILYDSLITRQIFNDMHFDRSHITFIDNRKKRYHRLFEFPDLCVFTHAILFDNMEQMYLNSHIYINVLLSDIQIETLSLYDLIGRGLFHSISLNTTLKSLSIAGNLAMEDLYDVVKCTSLVYLELGNILCGKEWNRYVREETERHWKDEDIDNDNEKIDKYRSIEKDETDEEEYIEYIKNNKIAKLESVVLYFGILNNNINSFVKRWLLSVRYNIEKLLVEHDVFDFSVTWARLTTLCLTGCVPVKCIGKLKKLTNLKKLILTVRIESLLVLNKTILNMNLSVLVVYIAIRFHINPNLETYKTTIYETCKNKNVNCSIYNIEECNYHNMKEWME